MPLVAGQLLKGSVIRVDRKTVWLDVGLAKHAKFFRYTRKSVTWGLVTGLVQHQIVSLTLTCLCG